MSGLPETPELLAVADAANLAYPPIKGHDVLATYEQAADLARLGQQIGRSSIGKQIADQFALEKLSQADAELFSLQEELRELTQAQRAKLNQYLATIPGAQAETETDHVGVLQTDPVRLKQFLARHDKNIRDQQRDPTFLREVAQHKQRFLAATEWGVHNNWLSPSILSANATVQQADVHIGDMWDTVLQSGMRGYHARGSDNVVIAQNIGQFSPDDTSELRSKLDHEVSHEYIHLQLDKQGSWLPRWLREGRAEHIKLALNDRSDQSFGVVDPSARVFWGVDERQTYSAERSVIALLLKGGKERVDPRLFTLGATANGPNTAAWTAFAQALDYSWGRENVISWVTQSVEKQEQAIRHQNEQAHTADQSVELKSDFVVNTEALEAVELQLVQRSIGLQHTPQLATTPNLVTDVVITDLQLAGE